MIGFKRRRLILVSASLPADLFPSFTDAILLLSDLIVRYDINDAMKKIEDNISDLPTIDET